MNYVQIISVILILASFISSSCNNEPPLRQNTTDQTSWIAENDLNTLTTSIRSIDDWVRILHNDENHTKFSGFFPLSLGQINGQNSIKISDTKTATALLEQLCKSNQTNGIAKLYAELLATKLNIVSGIRSDQIAGILPEIDFFLAEYKLDDWRRLSEPEKDTIAFWGKLLHWFNAGELNPQSPEVIPHSLDLAFKE